MQRPADSNFWMNTDIRVFAVFASLLLSAFNVWSNPVPNTDAFTYIRTAEIFLEQGLAAALAHYSWAFYSILIACLHSLTGLEIFAAAQVLNALFYALLCWAFITVVSEYDSSRRLAILSALVILVYPQINEYRNFLIRDIAFLAFNLFALLQLTRYARWQKLRHALFFCLFCLAAALFRPEALLYLVCAPFGLLAVNSQPVRVRLRQCLTVQGITTGLALCVLLAIMLTGRNPVEQLVQGFRVYTPFLQQATALVTEGSPELSAALFHEHASIYSEQYMTLFLLTGLAAILLVKLITGFGWTLLLILAYGWRCRLLQIPRYLAAPATAWLLTAFAILLAFILVTRYLSTRYTLMFCTVVVLLVPVIIDRAWQKAERENQLGWFRGIATFVLLFCFIDSYISFGASKDYQREVADWVAATSSADDRLLTNNAYVAYHTGLVSDYDRIERVVHPESVPAAASGTRIVYTLERGVLEMMQRHERQGLVSLERFFPDAEDPQLGVYRKN